MTTKVQGTEGIEFPDATVQSSAAYSKAESDGPAFSSYRANSVQNIPNSEYTKVQLNGSSFNLGNAFDGTTNYRFQPTVAGYYQFDAGANAQSGNNNVTSVIATLYKNGTEYYWNEVGTQTGVVRLSSTVSGLIPLNGTTDYVELYVYVTATSPFLNTGARTYMSGFLARRA